MAGHRATCNRLVDMTVDSYMNRSLCTRAPLGPLRVAATVGVCVILATACSEPHPPVPPVLRGSTAPTSTIVSRPADPGYLAARQQWIAEGLVFSSGDQNPPLSLAIADLRHGQITDRSNTAGYPAIIAAIQNLGALPLTDNTPAQRARGAADISEVSRFFHVPPLRTCGLTSGIAALAAAAAWNSEPHNTTSGVNVASLRRAAADLARQVRLHLGGTSCYPAAIADLRDLETATKANIAASSVEFTGGGGTRYGDEIAYLDTFFGYLTSHNGDWNVLTPLAAQCC
jgi:hypothetical protein